MILDASRLHSHWTSLPSSRRHRFVVSHPGAGVLNRLGDTTNGERIRGANPTVESAGPWANPGTDSQFPANGAGNSVSVPGLGARLSPRFPGATPKSSPPTPRRTRESGAWNRDPDRKSDVEGKSV